MILSTKLSRIIFLTGILMSFITIHFTNAIYRGGVVFLEMFKAFAENPIKILAYIGLLFVPALCASIVIPWVIRWVKSGT